MDTLDVHSPAILLKQYRNPAVAESRPLQRQLMYVINQFAFVSWNLLAIPLRRSGLADHSANATLRITQPISKVPNRPPSAGWGYKFFELYSMASFRISMSIR